MLFIDGRAGSDKLAEKFDKDEYELTQLEFGDVMFAGNGPDGDILIGIEYKKVADMIDCIYSGRFSGTQLLGMLNTYDICALIVEGNYQPNWNNGKVMLPFKGGNGLHFGIQYSSFDNFLTQIPVHACGIGKPFIFKKSMTQYETVQIVRDMYNLYTKPWDAHVSMARPDKTKMRIYMPGEELIKAEPGDAIYPEFILRESVMQVKGFSRKKAGQVAKHFGTVETALKASQKEWEQLKDIGVGKVLAERVFLALHGYIDPAVTLKKKKGKKNVQASGTDNKQSTNPGTED